ncbi:MAG: hypothetical protein HY343_11425, partial [Lentisphaerae bacterium]|nr:hypothetical protein [Lentisphaerota bacterium]
HLGLAAHHRKAGRTGPSAFHLDRAQRYAVLFRRVCSAHIGADGQPYYLWPFADYYERHADDVGHANYNVLFAGACHRENMVFTAADMAAFRGTFRRILTGDGRVPHRMIDGTDLDNVSDCVHYWHLLDIDDPALLARSLAYYSRNRDSILDLVTIGFVLHSLGRLV